MPEKPTQEAKISLRYLNTEQAAKALKQLFDKQLTLKKNENKQTLKIQTEEVATLAQAISLLAQIDLPTQNIPSYWFQLTYLDAELAAEIIQKTKPQSDEFVLTPDPRTNRIFFMGSKEDKEWVAKWIEEADTKVKQLTPFPP